jgi:dihydroorotate dehydrogenase (NAD+) catalytic subunit
MTQRFTYDVTRTWEENYRNGPLFSEAPPKIPDTGRKRFLGLSVRSRIGISAGLLLNSQWLLPYAERGFDLLTYKTVRSSQRASHPLPNWVFVEDTSPPLGPVVVTDRVPEDPCEISSAVCFGMPSVGPEIWRSDVEKIRRHLADGQVLIVSVVASPNSHSTLDDIADDFAICARWAVEAGAHVIEANLSCPNVCSAEGSLYHDAVASRSIALRIRASIDNVPLLLKVSTFRSQDAQREFMMSIDGVANGITLVNCITRPVLYHDGCPVFGPDYRSAGVLGRAIHQPAVDLVRQTKEIIERSNLSLEIAAVGGVAGVEDMQDFWDAGADAILCGSSPMYNPSLAYEIKKSHPEW